MVESWEHKETEEGAHKKTAQENGSGMRLLLVSTDPTGDLQHGDKSQDDGKGGEHRVIAKCVVGQEATVDADPTRKLSWFGGGGASSIESVSEQYLLDPSQEYDKWAQAYRMLGGYIDCDHHKDDDDHHSGDDQNYEENESACSRWMIWASVR